MERSRNAPPLGGSRNEESFTSNVTRGTRHCSPGIRSNRRSASGSGCRHFNRRRQRQTAARFETHEGFWGKVNPFARKKYVQRQVQPMQDRVNELDELTASNAKQIKDVDSRAQQGIQLASAKADQADQHAIDAGNKAQTAQQTADQANTRLTTRGAGCRQHRSIQGYDPDRNPFPPRTEHAQQESQGRA